MTVSKLIRQNFSMFIKAKPEIVWNKMLDPESYKYWTQEFEPTSFYKGELRLGGQVQFLSEGNSGMLATVAKMEEYKMIGFEFTGTIENGIKDESKANPFYQGVEEYYFESKDGGTELKIIADMTPEYIDYMSVAWPKALARLKELSENNK